MALCVLGRESSNDFPNEFWFDYLNNNKIKQELNSRSLIQLLETLPVELTGVKVLFF